MFTILSSPLFSQVTPRAVEAVLAQNPSQPLGVVAQGVSNLA